MPDVAIARYDATTGWLPPVCPKHGRPADHAIRRKFSTPTPPWVYALLLFSLLIAALAQHSVQKTDEISLPGCPDCTSAVRTRLVIRWVTGVVALLVLVAAITTGSAPVAVIFVAVALVWLVTLSSLMSGGQVSGTLDGPWLRLKGVHPAFMAALRPNPAWAVPASVGANGSSYPAETAYWPPPQSR
jgi:hypothetical protein